MLPALPFMDRMGLVFLTALLLAVVVSLATPNRAAADTNTTRDLRYASSTGFNIGATGVLLILVTLYATWW